MHLFFSFLVEKLYYVVTTKSRNEKLSLHG